MEFRPCIDIHNGKVKQIVGSSLRDEGDAALENFVSQKGSEYYAGLYKELGLKGGHIILLNSVSSEYFQATREEAIRALKAYPGGMQIGGGINATNALDYIQEGASHVIVTSYVFCNGEIKMDRIKELCEIVGKEHLVLDLSCKKTQDGFMIATDRWQNITKEKLTVELLNQLSMYCDEFLIHAVDVEGKSAGIQDEVVELLRQYEGNAVTYAGGIHNLDELKRLKTIGQNKINATAGSALDLFGGTMSFQEAVDICKM